MITRPLVSLLVISAALCALVTGQLDLIAAGTLALMGGAVAAH